MEDLKELMRISDFEIERLYKKKFGEEVPVKFLEPYTKADIIDAIMSNVPLSEEDDEGVKKY